ncbi:MAG: transcriptional regulator [Micavibrio sp.]|nr:MAG: transcriptional regulator [Micavibrio sp.]
MAVTLAKALLTIKTEEEYARVMKDLMTPQEIRVLEERWRIAQMLEAGEQSYREIAAETGASVTTIGRVARFLKEEPYQGYRILLERTAKK